MIHLDTNYLIAMVTLDTPQGASAQRWLDENEKIGVSAIAWTEFLTGPFSPHQFELASAIIQRVVPFGQAEAVCAAKLYNLAGRKREKRLDCMIAATAIISRAALATINHRDFTTFKTEGLFLA